MKKGKIELRKSDVWWQKSENWFSDYWCEKIKRRYIEMRETREKVEVGEMKRESLAAVHTHTHTHK